MEMGELSEEQANNIIAQAEVKAQEAEEAAAMERKRQREEERIKAATEAAEAAQAAAHAAEEPAGDAAPADANNGTATDVPHAAAEEASEES
jgi:N utilization substance protein A